MLGDGFTEEEVPICFTVGILYHLQLIAVASNYKTL
jgi:hypothetical protein